MCIRLFKAYQNKVALQQVVNISIWFCYWKKKKTWSYPSDAALVKWWAKTAEQKSNLEITNILKSLIVNASVKLSYAKFQLQHLFFSWKCTKKPWNNFSFVSVASHILKETWATSFSSLCFLCVSITSRSPKKGRIVPLRCAFVTCRIKDCSMC